MIVSKRLIFVFFCLLPAALATFTKADMLAIRGGCIIPVSGEEIEDAVILIENGKIKALGTDVFIPREARYIDAQDKTVIPGLIDPQSSLFLMDTELSQKGGAPEQSVLDALDLFNEDYKEVLAQGITTVCVVPTSPARLAGRAVVLRLNGKRTLDKIVLKSDVAVKGSIGLSENNESSSLTRLDHYASIRETFIATQNYLKRWEKYEHELAEYEKKKEQTQDKAEDKQKDKAEDKQKDKAEDKPKDKAEDKPKDKKLSKRPDKPSKNPTYEMLAKVLRNEIPLRIEAHRVDDIRHALRLAKEFKFSLILDKCTEGWRIAEEIARHKTPAIIGPVLSSFVDMPALEYRNHNPENAAILSQHGIQLALGTSARDGAGSKFLASIAAVAVGHGMNRNQALRAITLTPAEILGVANYVGSLDVGKYADIVILSGHPLDSFTRVEMVLIQGETVYERKSTK